MWSHTSASSSLLDRHRCLQALLQGAGALGGPSTEPRSRLSFVGQDSDSVWERDVRCGNWGWAGCFSLGGVWEEPR